MKEPKQAFGADCYNPRLIVIEVAGTRDRSGKRQFIARYPYKGYAGLGRTREQALGSLLLKWCADYLELEIRSI